ncbi:MAG: hypothetical protein NZL96_00050 [Patescibacteria group bacterium]|nr:hypothetical protein [Patescibacteria group bacterium]
MVDSAKAGDYYLEAQGVSPGDYQIVVGQISETNDIWESITGKVT